MMLFLPISHPQRDEELETTCFTGPLMPENNLTHPVFVPAAQDMGKKITQQHIPRPGWDETVTLLIRTGKRRSKTMSDLGKSDSRAPLPQTGLTAYNVVIF
jgi:hypothetical protein